MNNYFESNHDSVVVIPDGVTEIEDGAFFHRTDLISIELPKSISGH